MEKVIEELSGSFEKLMNSTEHKHPYVVAYRKKSDGSLIGYHLSTFCQITDDKFLAKRYDGDNPYRQLQTIQNNITRVLETDENDTGLFAPVRLAIKNNYFSGLEISDISLDAEYLEDAPKQHFKLDIISK